MTRGAMKKFTNNFWLIAISLICVVDIKNIFFKYFSIERFIICTNT